MPPPVTPDQIITYGKMVPRPLHLDVSVVSYFQEMFTVIQQKKKRVISSQSKFAHKVQANTASAQNPS